MMFNLKSYHVLSIVRLVVVKRYSQLATTQASAK